MDLQVNVISSSPMGNNVVILYEGATRQAIIIDPSFEPENVLTFIEGNALTVEMILFTHGHFDHFAGLAYLLANLEPKPKTALHKADLALWQAGGGSVHFRIPMDIPLDPDLYLTENQVIKLKNSIIQVRHAPGHSPGSVVFYIDDIKTAVVGDLIFYQGIGRTDLDGGSFNQLRKSIETQIFTLPPQTLLIPGHGPTTTVGEEMRLNPYVGAASQFL